ncbi:hypothetical protein BJY04DRAFT_199666 [Aspergillus karnatakaensis]|uniref:uncharacterized protein n=1 Tax=Aspergillus karnatakaensis TaxID=1810916 RepID=UPI003CCD7497
MFIESPSLLLLHLIQFTPSISKIHRKSFPYPSRSRRTKSKGYYGINGTPLPRGESDNHKQPAHFKIAPSSIPPGPGRIDSNFRDHIDHFEIESLPAFTPASGRFNQFGITKTPHWLTR